MVERLTLREKQSGIAWQKLIRDQAVARYAGKEWWQGVNVSLKKAMIRPTTRAIAEKIILEYEWLGTLPAPCQRFYGIFFDGWACGGVTCLADATSGGANNNAHAEFGIKSHELTYLMRGACTHWTPAGAGSKLISFTLRFEAEQNKKVAIAYSDTDAGEIGTLYQATNWSCIGLGGATTQFVHPKTGRVYDQKIVYDLRRRFGLLDSVEWSEMRDHLVKHGWKTQQSNPKYRYIYILAKGAEYDVIYSRIAHKIIPYPKRNTRAVSIEGDASSDPTGRGRFDATTALQERIEEAAHA